jgi:hypothetical protein
MIKRFTKSLGSFLEVRVSGHARQGALEQRRTPRSCVNLPLKVSVLGIEVDAGKIKYSQSMNGHTRDLSIIGLSFVVSVNQINGLDLIKNHPRLRIVLGLPSRTVEVFGTTVRVAQIRGSESEKGWLVGVRITKMSQEDKSELFNYLCPPGSSSSGGEDLQFAELSRLD